MNSIKIPISKVIKYYNHSLKIIEVSNLISSYREWLNKEEKLLLKIIQKECDILEIGAGNGRIINILNNKRRNIMGIDIANLFFLKKNLKVQTILKF